jgi:hypothetical protein
MSVQRIPVDRLARRATSPRADAEAFVEHQRDGAVNAVADEFETFVVLGGEASDASALAQQLRTAEGDRGCAKRV